MAELGTLCIVLHGHLPYVLHHGSYPHGEAWLYEAAAETYLPLLDMVGEAALLKARPALTMGLTPVLLEQLGHPWFKAGFVAYLKERAQRAAADRKDFEGRNDGHSAWLAQSWEKWFNDRLDHFNRIKQDIPGEFAARFREGHIQILTSNATHAFMPLILNDQMLRAQMSAGTAASERHLGVRPRGMWLPECAYRPSWDNWMPTVLYDNPRYRVGLEQFIADAGVTHFFVDTHLITGGQAMGTVDLGNFSTSAPDQADWDHTRAWRSVLEPVGVSSTPQMARCFAFGRHPRVSEQVWSGKIGYPGAPQYLEFHRKYGERGLRYHKVTDNKMPLSDKHPYYPDDVPSKLFEHSRHFCDVVRETLREYRNNTGRTGVVVAPFDAELFGHWWFEGPRFLREVVLTLANDPEVRLRTAEEALWNRPADKVMRLPEGSWGENGNHSVWINDRNRWMWEIEYRAEGRMLKLLHELPWRTNESVAALMKRAGRQLLLLQASDWPFVVHTQGATDYGTQRFAGHATAFDRMLDIAERAAKGDKISDLERTEIADADGHDVIFADIDLNWWM